MSLNYLQKPECVECNGTTVTPWLRTQPFITATQFHRGRWTNDDRIGCPSSWPFRLKGCVPFRSWREQQLICTVVIWLKHWVSASWSQDGCCVLVWLFGGQDGPKEGFTARACGNARVRGWWTVVCDRLQTSVLEKGARTLQAESNCNQTLNPKH